MVHLRGKAIHHIWAMLTPLGAVAAIVVVIVLIPSYERASNQAPLQADAAAAAQPRPIPHEFLLAQPRSIHQVGLPIAATHARIPRDNPQSPEKIALGEKLFFDARLSVDGSVSCSTCHDPARAFTDGRPASVGVKGRVGQRNAPTILNALYNKTQFWDGRAKTLEEQAGFPIVNPSEMGQPNMEVAVKGISSIPEYREAFQKVFGRPPNGEDLVRAIASYERTLYSFDSPFDHYIAGDQNAINASAKRGWEIFNTRGRCYKCHALTDTKRDPTYFTDNDFHNIGVLIIRHNVTQLACQAQQLINSGNKIAVDQAAIQSEMSALGRFLITKKDPDIASFKTPNLRNVLMTAPYFHDGSHATLWDVMDHYNKGAGLHDPYLDSDIRPLALSETDIDDVIALMASLTSPEYHDAAVKELERQRALSRTQRPQRDTARAFGPKIPEPKPLTHCPPPNAHP